MRLFGYDILVRRDVKRLDRKHNRVFSLDYFMPQRERLVFSQSELLDCQKKISDRLANAVFSFEKSDDLSLKCKEIKDFLQDNRLQLIQRIFTDGYVIINTESLCFVKTQDRQINRTFNGSLSIELRCDEVAYASETFEATGFGDFYFLRDKLRFLDSVNSSDFNLIENYGAMGIVSPESDNSVTGAEFNKEDIKEMQEEYKKSYGITVGKWSLMFVPRPTRYTPIQLPVAALQLTDKRLQSLKSLYEAFGIPKELSVYFENTTYANREQAELDMYGNTVSKWAKVFCKIGMLIYNNIASRVDYLLPNDLYFDFRGVPALQKAILAEKDAARAEYDFWRKIKIEQPQHADVAEQRISDIIDNL